jgi:DNA polymerase III epsilon subunit-like protein
LDENSGGEVRYKGEWIEVGKDLNPTLGFDLKKLKPQPRLCELGCNKIIDNQVIEKRLLTYPEKHWRTKCSCGKQLGPNGEILKDNNHAMSAFAQYFKDKK